MKFRTEIDIAPWSAQIDHQSHIIALGSCFAENMAARMLAHKFKIVSNPTGVLFNPLSIAQTIEQMANNEVVTPAQLHHAEQGWFNFDMHGSFTEAIQEEALSRMNVARKNGAEALQRADNVMITFGTSWVYQLEGRVVANCHKQPSKLFTRRRLSVDEVVERYMKLLDGALADKQIILTVSPIRHLGDGAIENSASKAVLRLAAEELATVSPHVRYFPAFELLIDDLRDYRFYGEDMVHPSSQAIDYVWQKFSKTALTSSAQSLLPEIERIMAAALHRPLNPQSPQYAQFCHQQLDAIDRLSQLDFEEQRGYFERFFKIKC